MAFRHFHFCGWARVFFAFVPNHTLVLFLPESESHTDTLIGCRFSFDVNDKNPDEPNVIYLSLTFSETR